MSVVELTTLADVREFLQKQGTDTTQDGVIQHLITRASETINRQVGVFLPAETDVDKTFVWRGGPLALQPYFARDVTAVSLDSDRTSPLALEESGWRLRPKPPRDGVYRWLTFPSYAAPFDGEREVTVTGDWGFETVPWDVAHWTIVTVATWLRRDVSAFSTTLRLDEDRLERPDALPSAVMRGLARYMQPEAS